MLRRFPYESRGSRASRSPPAEVATGRRCGSDGFDSDGAWIDYARPARRRSPPTPSPRCCAGTSTPERLPEDKIVVVGASAPTLQDYGRPLPAAVSCRARRSRRTRSPACSRPPASVLADSRSTSPLILLLAVLGAPRPATACGRRRLRRGARGSARCTSRRAQLAFDAGLVLPVVYPLARPGGRGRRHPGAPLPVMPPSSASGFASPSPASCRRRWSTTFSAHGEDSLQLGGVRREGTVLFSDLRGFTSYSESREPAEVVEVLNRYLSEMTDAIMDHGGTLVAYMGDGIMAVFGAPIEQPDHADRAIAARAGDAGRPPAGILRVDARRGAWRRLRDGDRAEQRRGDVRPGRLRAAHGVHDDRRHDEHGSRAWRE